MVNFEAGTFVIISIHQNHKYCSCIGRSHYIKTYPYSAQGFLLGIPSSKRVMIKEGEVSQSSYHNNEVISSGTFPLARYPWPAGWIEKMNNLLKMACFIFAGLQKYAPFSFALDGGRGGGGTPGRFVRRESLNDFVTLTLSWP